MREPRKAPKKRRTDPLLDPELSQTELAEHFGVSFYRIKEIRALGFVSFRRSRRHGFPAWVARPRQFLDVPMYELHRVAKYVGKKSSRTIRRWFDAGEVGLTRRPRSRRLYATPRQMEEIRQYAQNKGRRGAPANPKKLLGRLGELGSRVPPPLWERSTDAWRRRR